MSFGNYQNEKKKKNKNTTATQFYNKNYGSTLAVSYLNEGTVILKIHPTLPENKQSQSNIYDYDSYVIAYLSPIKLIELSAAINEVQKSLVTNNSYDFDSVGISAGDGYVEIGTTEDFEISGEKKLAICIYNGIDANGEATNKLVYVFNSSNYYKNYARKKTDYDTSNVLESEFILFSTIIQEAIKASTNAIAHSIRNANKYQDNASYESIKEIKEKLGIKSISYNNNSTTSYFGVKNNQNKLDATANFGNVENGGTITEERIPLE